MFDFFDRIKLRKQSPSTPGQAFTAQFLAEPQHEWILKDKYLRLAFELLFERMQPAHLDFFRSHMVIFLQANAEYSCSLGPTNYAHVIIVFPDLQRMLRALIPNLGLAVLAHELGHVFRQHYRRNLHVLEAQLEADLFACDLGLGPELQDILLMHKESEECQIRIKAILERLHRPEE